MSFTLQDHWHIEYFVVGSCMPTPRWSGVLNKWQLWYCVWSSLQQIRIVSHAFLVDVTDNLSWWVCAVRYFVLHITEDLRLSNQEVIFCCHRNFVAVFMLYCFQTFLKFHRILHKLSKETENMTVSSQIHSLPETIQHVCHNLSIDVLVVTLSFIRVPTKFLWEEGQRWCTVLFWNLPLSINLVTMSWSV